MRLKVGSDPIAICQAEKRYNRTCLKGSLLLHSETKNWWLAYEKVVVKKFQRHNIFPQLHFILIFLVRTLQCFTKKIYFLLPMKKPSPKVGNNSYFLLTALSCPYGQKLEIHVKNWAEAPSVESTLWCQATTYRSNVPCSCIFSFFSFFFFCIVHQFI